MSQKLELEVVAAEALSASERALWSGFVGRSRAFANPFFRPEFTMAAARVCPQARVAVLHRASEIVGFFPFQLRGQVVQPLAAPLSDYHAAIVAPGERVNPVTLTELLRAPVQLFGWTGPEPAGLPAAAGLTQRTAVFADTSNGWEAYDAERRGEYGKFFKDKERARRSLERDHGAAATRFGDRSAATLDELVRRKRDQYRRTGQHDVFACGWTRDLLAELLAVEAEGFGASMAVLEAGGELVAIEYSLRTETENHFWFPVYDARFSRFSPGILLTIDTIRHGAGEGVRTFDFGFEGEPYKKYFVNRRRLLLEGRTAAPGLDRALTRAAALAERGADTLTGGRASNLSLRLRRRLSLIDACEPSLAGRAAGAAGLALAIARRGGSGAGSAAAAAGGGVLMLNVENFPCP